MRRNNRAKMDLCLGEGCSAYQLNFLDSQNEQQKLDSSHNGWNRTEASEKILRQRLMFVFDLYSNQLL